MLTSLISKKWLYDCMFILHCAQNGKYRQLPTEKHFMWKPKSTQFLAIYMNICVSIVCKRIKLVINGYISCIFILPWVYYEVLMPKIG